MMDWVRSCVVVLLVTASLAGADARAEEPQIESVYRDMVVLAWRIQFHYVWTGEYPEALDRVLKGKPGGEKQTLEPDDIVDPFSPLKLPYGYILAEDGKSFVVYSVGPDGVDERGQWMYPFWPSSHLWTELPDKGSNGTIRGDLLIDSKELAEHALATSRDDLAISSPLLFEYMGARYLDLSRAPATFAEDLGKELKELNTPGELESRREPYLETFSRFCAKYGIEIRALDDTRVDHALARSHAPIPKKTGGRYELLDELARACGLRIISANAGLIEGRGRRVVVSQEPREKEPAFVLLLEPYWWSGDNNMLTDVSTVLTDPTDRRQLDRLVEVCKGVATVRGHTLEWFAPWFLPVLRQVVGMGEDGASDEQGDSTD